MISPHKPSLKEVAVGTRKNVVSQASSALGMGAGTSALYTIGSHLIGDARLSGKTPGRLKSLIIADGPTLKTRPWSDAGKHFGKGLLWSLPIGALMASLKKEKDEDLRITRREAGMIGGSLAPAATMALTNGLLRRSIATPRLPVPLPTVAKHMKRIPTPALIGGAFLGTRVAGSLAGKKLHSMITKEGTWRPLVGTEEIGRRLEKDFERESVLKTPKDTVELDNAGQRLRRFRESVKGEDPYSILDIKRTVSMDDARKKMRRTGGISAGVGAALGALAGHRGGMRTAIPMSLAGAVGGGMGGLRYGRRFPEEASNLYDDLEEYLAKNASFYSPFMSRHLPHLKATQKMRNAAMKSLKASKIKPGDTPGGTTLLTQLKPWQRLLAAGGIGAVLAPKAVDMLDGKNKTMNIDKEADFSAIDAKIASLVEDPSEVAYLQGLVREAQAYVNARSTGDKIASDTFKEVDEVFDKKANGFLGNAMNYIKRMDPIKALVAGTLLSGPVIGAGKMMHDKVVDPFIEQMRFNRMMNLEGRPQTPGAGAADAFYVPTEMGQEERDQEAIRKMFNLVHKYNPEMTSSPEVVRSFLDENAQNSPLGIMSSARDNAAADVAMSQQRARMRNDLANLLQINPKAVDSLNGIMGAAPASDPTFVTSTT